MKVHNTQLDNCPFCNGESYLAELTKGWRIRCKKCCIGSPYFNSSEKAISYWNSRVNPSTNQSSIEKIKKASGVKFDSSSSITRAEYEGILEEFPSVKNNPTANTFAKWLLSDITKQVESTLEIGEEVDIRTLQGMYKVAIKYIDEHMKNLNKFAEITAQEISEAWLVETGNEQPK